MKRSKCLILIILLFIFVLTACKPTTPDPGGHVDPPKDHVIEISSKQARITIKNEDISTYNFKDLFTIKVDNKEIEVLDKYIDLSQLSMKEGNYTITCNYKNKTCSIDVKVIAVEYSVLNVVNDFPIKDENVDSYDYTKLFKIYKDQEEIQVINDYLDLSNLRNTPGAYVITCTYKNKTASINIIVSKTVYEVLQTVKSLDINDEDVATYDFTQLFRITKDGNDIEVKQEYVDSSFVLEEEGTYNVICKFNDIILKVKVNVHKTKYTIKKSAESIDIKVSDLKTFDYLKLFKLYREGIEMKITDDMIETNIQAIVGSYYLTFKYKNIDETILVNVVPDHTIDIVKTVKELELTVNEYKTYDYTNLFILYLDGAVTEINNSNLTYELLEYNVGDSFNVSLNYSYEGLNATSSIKVTIIDNDVYKVLTKEITIYPNSKPIDFTTLFELYREDVKLDVNLNDIKGSVNYSKVGKYEIVYTFNNVEYISIVNVKFGVLINYRYKDTILITKGTNQNNYDFANDFDVIINGIKFLEIPNYFLDLSNVNFDELGNYEVTLTIPYNEKKLGLSSVNFTYYTKTITYQVVPLKYSLDIKEDIVEINSEKDILKNVNLKLGNLSVDLTTNKDWASDLYVYCEFDSLIHDTLIHNISLKIYVFGLEQEPITVNFKYQFKDQIILSSVSKTIYTGDTIYLTDLFAIKENDINIEVKSEMITGAINFFKVGNYVITLTYKNHTTEAIISILDSSIKGRYKTPLRTVPETALEDDEEVITKPAKAISDFVIDDDGSYHFDNRTIEVIRSVDENTIELLIGDSNYTMHYDNGIIILNPLNEHKLSFNNANRPLVFFNTNIYKIDNIFTINYLSSGYIIFSTITGYSIDTFQVTNLETKEQFWYGLNVALTNKTSSDSIYEVSWGYCEFDDQFSQATSSEGTLYLNEQEYVFNVVNPAQGLIDKNFINQIKYINSNFNTTIDNIQYRLTTSVSESFTFRIGTQMIFNMGNSEIKNSINGYIDYKNDIIFAYAINNSNYGTYSYKFKVNTNDNSFIIYDKDDYYGLYLYNDMYIFIDGYNTGIAKFKDNECGFKYTVTNNQMYIEFNDGNFGYGQKIMLYTSELYNVLTVGDCDNSSLMNIEFENSIISKGAIVHLDKFYFYGSPSFEKEDLIRSIKIITKDGILSDSEKTGKIPGTNVNYIVTSKIKFGTAGFYELVINIPVGNEIISKYYSVEILKEVYKDNSIVDSYGYGLLNKNIYLELNSYGVGIVNIDGVQYKGLYNTDGASFVLRAYDEKKSLLTLMGNVFNDGILYVRSSGAAIFNDYFTIGTSKIVGNANYKLRNFQIKDKDIYIISKADNSYGDIVAVDIIDDIYYINYDNKELRFKINSWNDLVTGLVEPDIYYGEYRNGEDKLFIDGFGSAKLTAVGKYEILVYQGATYMTIDSSDDFIVVRIDISSHTYQLIDIKLDNSLIINHVYTSEYTFICNDEEYQVSTSFSFLNDGKVVITSTSASHDSSCVYDRYEPVFMTNNGTYTVSGNVVNVVSGGYTFSFVIENIMNPISLKTILTNLGSDEPGYFKIGTQFTTFLE